MRRKSLPDKRGEVMRSLHRSRFDTTVPRRWKVWNKSPSRLEEKRLRVASATSKGSDVSRRKTSSNEGESMTKSCVTTKDKECVAYVIKATDMGMVLRWKRLGQVNNGRRRKYFLHTCSRDLGSCIREPTEDLRDGRWQRGSKGRRRGKV